MHYVIGDIHNELHKLTRIIHEYIKVLNATKP